MYCLLLTLTLAADPDLRPAPPAPIPETQFAEAIRRGVEHLVTTQNKDGSWGSPRWTGGVDNDPLTSHHSFQTATTALCVEALLEVGGDSPEVKAALDKGTANLVAELNHLKRADRGNLPNVWAHGYGAQTLVALHRRTSPTDAATRKTYEDLIKSQLEQLAHYETVHGGWFYYASGFQRPNAPSCSFVDAAILTSMHRAKALGLEASKPVLDRAVAQLKSMRNPDASFVYSQTTTLDANANAAINRSAGSLGRSQAGNVALRLYGDPKTTDDVIKIWLDRLVTRQGWLDMGRKRPIPHESHAQVAGYFYYFGHYYAGLAISLLPPADRPFYQDHLAKILIDRQEPADGSWWDYPLFSYHKPYGTAFALLALGNCRRAR